MFIWRGNRFSCSASAVGWSFDLEVPEWRPRGERQPVELELPWSGASLNVWRMFSQLGPDTESSTTGLLFEREDGMGIGILICPETEALRLTSCCWRTTADGLTGNFWLAVAPIDADGLVSLLDALAEGRDSEIFSEEFLAADKQQREAHNGAGAR